MDVLGRLSESSRQILALAKKQAAFFQHDQIRPEHLLLALVAVPTAAATRFMRRQGVDPQALVREIVGQLSMGRAVDTRMIILAPSLRRAIEVAGDEAQQMGAARVGTEHLLLGLLADTDGLPARAMAKLGLDVDVLRQQAHLLAEYDRRVPPGEGGRNRRSA